MPIYEYTCHACGLEKEHLQKMSDAPLASCPACGSSNYVKKVSAAGFQLKGTGWYVTDFKNKNAKKVDSKSAEETGKTTINTDSPPAAASTAPSTTSPAD